MSGIDAKKPETREDLVKMVAEAAKKSSTPKATRKRAPAKPTVSGTAQSLNIHRDTLYTWLKEFNVDFKEILDRIPTTVPDESVERAESAYMIGEALLGEGNELAHVD